MLKDEGIKKFSYHFGIIFLPTLFFLEKYTVQFYLRLLSQKKWL